MEESIYFVMETEKDIWGYIPLIAVKGRQGYYKTDWHWNCTFEEAQKLCDEKMKGWDSHLKKQC
jgi:hypothetical protein